MRNLDKLLLAYGTLSFLRRSLPETQTDRRQMINVMAESMTLIEKCIKKGMSGFDEANAQLCLTKIYETMNMMLDEIELAHVRVCGTDSPLLMEALPENLILPEEEINQHLQEKIVSE